VKAATLHRSDFVQQNVANTKTHTNILNAREMTLKPFRDTKFELLSSDAKSERESQLEETVTIRLYDQFSWAKRHLIGTTSAFLIF
jgi:hypothetical protein